VPNYCYNSLTITTKTPKQFAKLIQGITNDSEQPFDFNRIIPMPQELLDSPSPNNVNPNELIQKYGFPSWYEWRCAKWGTKWNASDVVMNLETPTEVHISFSTAWSPPIPVIETLAKKYPFADVTLSYEEEGMSFHGEIGFSEGKFLFQNEGEIDCEWRWEHYGECNCETDCGICDCECGCSQNTKQTICSSCNENDHQNNNDLPQYKSSERK